MKKYETEAEAKDRDRQEKKKLKLIEFSLRDHEIKGSKAIEYDP